MLPGSDGLATCSTSDYEATSPKKICTQISSLLDGNETMEDSCAKVQCTTKITVYYTPFGPTEILIGKFRGVCVMRDLLFCGGGAGARGYSYCVFLFWRQVKPCPVDWDARAKSFASASELN